MPLVRIHMCATGPYIYSAARLRKPLSIEASRRPIMAPSTHTNKYKAPQHFQFVAPDSGTYPSNNNTDMIYICKQRGIPRFNRFQKASAQWFTTVFIIIFWPASTLATLSNEFLPMALICSSSRCTLLAFVPPQQRRGAREVVSSLSLHCVLHSSEKLCAIISSSSHSLSHKREDSIYDANNPSTFLFSFCQHLQR